LIPHPYDEVTDIFIRANPSETKLRISDSELAQITSAWPGPMKYFDEFVYQCITKNFYLDEYFRFSQFAKPLNISLEMNERTKIK
jgi:hypothetical protein